MNTGRQLYEGGDLHAVFEHSSCYLISVGLQMHLWVLCLLIFDVCMCLLIFDVCRFSSRETVVV